MKLKQPFCIIVFFVAFISFQGKAQNYIDVYVSQSPVLTINAGNDTTICQNGSVVLDVITNGGTVPYSFFWQPSTGLSSVTEVNPTASPDITTTYSVTVLDSLGCTETSSITIYVDPCLDINKTTSVLSLCLFPNITDGVLNININTTNNSQLLQIMIYNQFGQIVFKENIGMIYNNMNKEINVASLASGNYLLKVIGEKIYEVKKFVKK